MRTKIHVLDHDTRKAADRIRGRMNYAEHYSYLLDWYMNDRKNWRDVAGIQAAPVGVHEHVKESLEDVLDSLKHLEYRIRKVEKKHKALAASVPPATGEPVIQKTVASQYPEQKDANRFARLAGPMKTNGSDRRQGSIFTRLVDPRRFNKQNC